jgi:nucleotide-binding universal stress UspA family protein
MYAHFLVPIDGSKFSERALGHALALAKATKGRITVFHASPGYPEPVYAEGVRLPQMTPREYAESARKAAAKILDRAAAKAKTAGIACATLHAIDDQPWSAIIAAARKARADTIVMASHGRRGLAGLLLGSETNKVLTHSKVPVVVVR